MLIHTDVVKHHRTMICMTFLYMNWRIIEVISNDKGNSNVSWILQRPRNVQANKRIYQLGTW